MSRLRHNLVANLGGQAWAMLMGIAFVPVYVRVLGIEAYGLIGFFLSLQVFLSILDLGLSSTLSRELARLRHTGSSPDGPRDLLRTLEWIYWPTGLLIAAASWAGSGAIAAHWLHPVTLDQAHAARAIALLGLSFGLQWPWSCYAGGFRGIERQVRLNALSTFFATLRHGGAALVLLYASPRLEAFLWWQVGVSLLQSLAFRSALWHTLPAGSRPAAFSAAQLRALRAFASGLALISVTSFLLTQSDRLLLATLLPLDELGYYTLAATLAAAMGSIAAPFVSALFPRFSGLVARGDEPQLLRLYHRGTQLLVLLVAPVACFVAAFSNDILRLWTGDALVAARSGLLLAVLAAGTGLNMLLSLPYALQLAHGRTRLALRLNIASVALAVPAIWVFGSRFGGIGAACVWLGLNIAYVMVGVPLMHRATIGLRFRDWWRRDVQPPLLAAVAVVTLARLALPTDATRLGLLLLLGATAAIALAASALAANASRP
jgi:O-antigen/teichoic acid export membrane protein